MKCIIASPVACYPAKAGNSARIQQMVKFIEQLGYEVHFVLCPIQAMNPQLDANEMAKHFPGRFYQLSNEPRPLQQRLINFKRRYYHRIHKIGLLYDTIFSDGYVCESATQQFKQIVADIAPQVILINYAFLSCLINGLTNQNSIKTIIDTQDKFSYRNKGIRQAGSQGYWLSLSPYQERKLLARADIVIGIQNQESEYFRQLLTSCQSHVATLDILHKVDAKGLPSKDLVIGFIASNNFHNAEGLKQFIALQWPTILSNYPAARLLIAGSICQTLNAVPENTEIIDWVEKLEEFYHRCRVVINPCSTGSGLKIKTIEAISYGIPVVVTPCGAAGIEFLLQNHNIAELQSNNFAIFCKKFLDDYEFARNSSATAITLLNKRVDENRNKLVKFIAK